MKWIKVEAATYYPVFRCSNCGASIIVADECFELPSYCKNCGQSIDWSDDNAVN